MLMTHHSSLDSWHHISSFHIICSDAVTAQGLFLAATKQLLEHFFLSVCLSVQVLTYHIKTLQEESAKKSNIPWIWRIIYGHKLPYMKKTRKKKQVCGAACYMAVEMKFSKDVRPSVTPFSLCSHHRIILKFSGVITIDWRDVHAKGQDQRSKVKVTEVMTPFSRFRTVTPVCIHIWWWNVAQSLMLLRRGALMFFKVIRQISRSRGSKNRWIWPK